MSRIKLTFYILFLILRAKWIKRGKIKNGLKLPPVGDSSQIDGNSVSHIVHWTDLVIKVVLYRNAYICFYRSFILAQILRKKGIPLVLNVGGRSLNSHERMKAHCWLTLNGQDFYEKPNSMQLYPYEMGYNKDKSIQYWIGPDLDETIFNSNLIVRTRSI